MTGVSFQLEENAAQSGALIIGLDEVGRGPLAGPVYAAAVCFQGLTLPACLVGKVKDSKKISKSKIDEIADLIEEHTISAVGIATVAEIGELNILHASLLAMKRAGEALCEKLGEGPFHFLVDGNQKPKLYWPMDCIVKGDSKSLSIAAASILAKSRRDQEMKRLDAEFPHYGWAQNAGYPTKDHRLGIAQYGKTIHHRDGFKLL